LNGTLDIDDKVLTLKGAESHLKVADKGAIVANAWRQFTYGGSEADDKVLLAALADSTPNDDNFHITIEAGSGPIYLDVGRVTAKTYASLLTLAKSNTLHLERIEYFGPPTAAERASAPLLVAKDNVVEYHDATPALPVTNTVTLGDIIVEDGGALRIYSDAPITDAGNITIVGNGRPKVATFAANPDAFSVLGTGIATFANSLKSLTIGSEAGQTTLVALDDATLAGADDKSVITVHKGATLKLNPTIAVNPGGKIDLKDGGEGKKGGQLVFSGDTTATISLTTGFSALKELVIGKEAAFTAVDTTPLTPYPVNNVTFASLTKLKVDGTLTVESNSISFTDLQNEISGEEGDVTGDGKAVFSNWAVTGATKGHAFDQSLGIKDVTVASVTGVPNTSGFDDDITPDRGTTTGAGYKLRVGTFAGDASGLTIDRDLYVTTSISGGAANSITVAPGASVYAKDGLALGGPDQTIKGTLTSGALTLTAAAKGEFSGAGAISLRNGTSLQIPGKLAITSGSFTAGTTGTAVTLAGSANTYLEKAAVSSTVATGSVYTATVTVNAEGTLSIGAASTVGTNSGIDVKAGGKIVSGIATPSVLTFSNIGTTFGGAIGGTLSATGSGGKIVNKTETKTVNSVPDVVFNITEVTGTLILSNGGTLTHAATTTAPHNEFRLTGSIRAINSLTAYDSAELGSTILNGVTFSGATGTITIPVSGALGRKIDEATATLVAAGSAKLTTRGSGQLVFGGTGASTLGLKTAAAELDLSGVILTPNTITGTLNLSAGSLVVGAPLNIGTATEPGSVTLSGEDAAIQFSGSYAVILNGATASTLKFGPYTVTGGVLIGSVTPTSSIVIPTLSPSSVTSLNPNDLYGAITSTTNAAAANLPVLTPGMQITAASGNISIAGTIVKFINRDSTVYSTTTQ
jgi:hypothetical protein